MILTLTRAEAYEFADAAMILRERIENAEELGYDSPWDSTLDVVWRLEDAITTNIGTAVGLYVLIPLITDEIYRAACNAADVNLGHYTERMGDNFDELLLRSYNLSRDISTKLLRK